MSDQDSTADTIAYYYSFQTGDFVFFASIVPLIYDYFLSFDRKMGLIWRGKRCGASLIYCIIRYNALLYEILNASTSIRSLTDQILTSLALWQSCTTLVHSFFAFQQLQAIPIAAFSGLRTYALSRSWPVSLTVGILALSPLGSNMAQYPLGLIGFLDPKFGCEKTYDATIQQVVIIVCSSRRTDVIVVATVSRAGLIISDIIVIAVTWGALRNSSALARPMHTQRRRSLIAAMLWNGSVYFVVLTVLNVLHLSFTLSATIQSDGAPSYVTAFTDPLTTILVCHFILDLQEASQKDMKLDWTTSTPGSGHPSSPTSDGTLNFARAMESMGSMVSSEPWRSDMYVEDGMRDAEALGSEDIALTQPEAYA
ncbi:hypothetical protein K466DRAFT_596719 [Polyporus arcularius HHB13444]|uniref:DUF6533 domain-containing protein n=1 Tax=Polyporus arcularius HHB13444 TaxID=1314778 RepID=A0A5C3PLV4_9APHY|nr:hypothetical protein K466DRAFT_596719 [Polyporus arcularius HHB13444]